MVKTYPPLPCPQHLGSHKGVNKKGIASLALELSQPPPSKQTIGHPRRAESDLQDVGGDISQRTSQEFSPGLIETPFQPAERPHVWLVRDLGKARESPK